LSIEMAKYLIVNV